MAAYGVEEGIVGGQAVEKRVDAPFAQERWHLRMKCPVQQRAIQPLTMLRIIALHCIAKISATVELCAQDLVSQKSDITLQTGACVEFLFQGLGACPPQVLVILAVRVEEDAIVLLQLRQDILPAPEKDAHPRLSAPACANPRALSWYFRKFFETWACACSA